MPAALADIVARGGTLVFGSAAACTLGTHSIPVYEVYKAGADPYWEDGLDLLGTLTGLRAVVVPHYDNAEGGRYDTRFCYLGEQRLAALSTSCRTTWACSGGRAHGPADRRGRAHRPGGRERRRDHPAPGRARGRFQRGPG